MHDPRLLVLLYLVMLHWLRPNGEYESATYAPGRLASDFAAELADNFSADVQTKADTARVYFLGLLNEAIQFKQLAHVLLLNSNSCIFD